jgi:sterol 3beta-glucosyltransferase
MRIVILTAGTRGDTQPYVALGLGFRRAGYQVRVVAGENFESFITQYGLEFAPIHTNLAELLHSEAAQKVLEQNNPVKMLLAQAKAFRSMPKLDGIQDDLWQACQGADVILFSPGLPNGYFIARYLGIPVAAINAVPMSPTGEFPAAIFYDGPRFGPLFNKLTHVLFEQAFWFPFRSGIYRFWQKQDRSVRIPFAAPNGRWRAEKVPVVYGFSEYVLPRPHDWPDYVSIAGYWFLDSEPGWSVSPALNDFLKAGAPPIYIGFGSMGSARKAREYTLTILKALEMTGQRGVLSVGWKGLSHVPLPSNVFMLESVPHAWLFPQMAAVVHHGGAGTTAAGLRAGVPSIIVPHTVDQPMWGKLVAKLGAGPAPIPRSHFTAEQLADAIRATMDNAMCARAREIGEKIAAEDGVTKAVKMLESYLP